MSGSAPTTPASTILPVLPALLTTDESEPCCCSSDDGDLVEAIAETKNALERLSEDDGKDEVIILLFFCLWVGHHCLDLKHVGSIQKVTIGAHLNTYFMPTRDNFHRRLSTLSVCAASYTTSVATSRPGCVE